jgi:hypothetical protein
MSRPDSRPAPSVVGSEIDEALVRAVRREMAMHKCLRLPIAVWRDGKAVWLPAEQIPVGVEEYEHPLSRPPTAER